MKMRLLLSFVTVVSLAGFACAESAGGLQWTAPAGWKSQPQRPMRAATYAVPAAAGDKEDGECAVFYFGPGQGGGVEANIQRWVSQFETSAKPQTAKKTINGLAVTTIDLSGTYLASAGPMAPTKTSKPGYRLLGAIVEGPQGGVFFKFTGPAKTVAAGQAAFDKMLAGIRL
jgi:hypothetical protein